MRLHCWLEIIRIGIWFFFFRLTQCDEKTRKPHEIFPVRSTSPLPFWLNEQEVYDLTNSMRNADQAEDFDDFEDDYTEEDEDEEMVPADDQNETQKNDFPQNSSNSSIIMKTTLNSTVLRFQSSSSNSFYSEVKFYCFILLASQTIDREINGKPI